MAARPFCTVNFASMGHRSQIPLAQQAARVAVGTDARAVAIWYQPSGNLFLSNWSGSENRCGGSGKGRDRGIGLSAGPATCMTASTSQ